MRIRKNIHILVLLSAFLLGTSDLLATHIVGGSISLTYVSGNNYRLTLKVLRDCYNGEPPFDGLPGSGGGTNGVAPAIVGMFDKGNNSTIRYIDMGLPVITNLQMSGPNCANMPEACTELGVYTQIIAFNPAVYNSMSGYYFSYQRCCRNSIIQNIDAPKEAGIAVYTEVPAFSLHNSTPAFFSNPFTFLCKGNPFKYNFLFSDADGDELRYSLVTPLNGKLKPGTSSSTTPESGPYPPVTWLPGFGDSAEIKGGPSLKINASTGEISVTPGEVGVYVAAIRVEEYRNGVKIGEVRLELQFNVTLCMSNFFPEVMYRDMNGAPNGGFFSVRIPNKLCFDIIGSDVLDSVYMTLTAKAFADSTIVRPYIDTTVLKPIGTDPYLFSGFKQVAPRICWQTDCSLTGLPQQLFNVEIRDNGCPVPMTTKSQFVVRIDSMLPKIPLITIKRVTGEPVDSVLRVRIPDELCFDVIFSSVDDSIYMEADGDPFKDALVSEKPVFSKPFQFNTFAHDSARMCWKTGCDLTGKTDQKFTFKATSSFANCFPETPTATVNVHIDSMPLVNPPDLLCMTLPNDNETIIEFGDSTLQDPFYASHHVYRAVNQTSFDIYDSLVSRVVRGTYVDMHATQNKQRNYQYYFRSVNTCGFDGPASDIYETLSNLKPTPDQQKLLTVTVENNNEIKLIWPQTPEKDFARYFIYRATRDNTNFLLLSDNNKIGDTVLVDKDVNVHEQSYCYYVIMKDTCENYGPPGKISCSILLQGKVNPFENHVNWTPYTYWDNGTRSYAVYKADVVSPFDRWTETNNQTVTLLDNKLNYDAGKFYYYVVASENPSSASANPDESSIMESRSNEIELIQAPVAYPPNVFSPNNDGINDRWDVRNAFVRDYQLRIYNKWGQKVFESQDKHKLWDGLTANGESAPLDVYVYVISYIGWDDSVHYITGNVTVLK